MEERADSLPAGKRLVLVADGDRQLRILAQTFIEAMGHAFLGAPDGIKAWEMTQGRPPDILVTEVLLPKLDGLALCRKVKGDPVTCHVQVLVFSILAAGRRAKESGADGFLAKPIARARLADALNILLRPQGPRAVSPRVPEA